MFLLRAKGWKDLLHRMVGFLSRVRVLSMEWPVSDLEVMADLEGF